MNNHINETELKTIVEDWQARKRAQPLKDHKLKVASARAYLLGAYLSDGHLLWPEVDDPHPQWRGLKDKYFADCISIALHTIGSPHSLRVYDRPMAVTPKSYSVYEELGGKLGWWLDDVAPDKDCLPKIPSEMVRPLVAGLMDGDGGARKTLEGTYQLYYSGKCGFVEGFYDLLRGLEVRVCQDYLKVRPHVSINIESFLRAGLCFAMYRKQRLLVDWCRTSIEKAKSRGWAADLRKASIAKWYLKNANHLKAGWSPAGERIPTGHATYQEGVK